jgi:hypothetical protein
VNSDELFKLPLSEFTAARNALIKGLQQAKRGDEAESVKALTKPSVSAWAVNQLYWNHRKEFDHLLKAGARLTQAHASQLSGKPADVQEPTAARREAVSALLRLAEKLLIDGGHSASPDTMHRIATTLETLSTPSASADAPAPGRLTNDAAPLGFESWVTLVPGNKPSGANKGATKEDKKDAEKAKAALKAAERERDKARTLAEEAAKNFTQAEKQYAKAKAAADEARGRLEESRAEAERTRKAAEDAERAVQIATRQA